VFPETVRYMRSDGASWPIRDWDTARKLLSYLHRERNPFVIFSLLDESYIQCFGSMTRLTVEAREFFDGGFRHWVFGRGPLRGEVEQVEALTGTVTVDVSQILRMRDARLIIREFLEHRRFLDAYERRDVSERFAHGGAHTA